MTLEFEKLTGDVERMAVSAQQRETDRQQLIDVALQKLDRYATDWDHIERCLDLALSRVDLNRFRAARPLDHLESMNEAVDPLELPDQATIIAVDGSQIYPDRHAPYLYSLINIGVMVYFHNQSQGPVQFTLPDLNYPGKDSRRFEDNSAIVSLHRDRSEIQSLARTVWQYQDAARPLLAVLDQRLLYWPGVGASGGLEAEGTQVLQAWQNEMSSIRSSGGLLAGYIVRPGKNSLITLLDALDIEEADFDLERLTNRDASLGLTDAHLFSRLLGPGQRSKVFVDVSQHNTSFREQEPENEICFFYINPGRTGSQIARVDIPMSVARNRNNIGAVHALIYEQCRILGDYPYVLARADEVAVVGRQDHENLSGMIGRAMERYGQYRSQTAKQSTKDIARAVKARHEV